MIKLKDIVIRIAQIELDIKDIKIIIDEKTKKELEKGVKNGKANKRET